MNQHDQETTDPQTAILRRLSPAQKWRVAEALYWQAREWKKAALIMQHPEWSAEKIGLALREQFAHGTTD